LFRGRRKACGEGRSSTKWPVGMLLPPYQEFNFFAHHNPIGTIASRSMLLSPDRLGGRRHPRSDSFIPWQNWPLSAVDSNTRILLAMAVVIVDTRAVGWVMTKFGQPR